MRIHHPTVLRVLVVVLGSVVAFFVYSYGMFHKLPPAWSDFAEALNCGVPSGATYHVEDTAAPGAGDSPLCAMAPGRWPKTPYGNASFFLALLIAFCSAMVALHRTAFLKWATPNNSAVSVTAPRGELITVTARSGEPGTACENVGLV
jgi:hypothetical protein